MTEASPYDNPLIPNAQLREMYLVMLRVRLAEQALPPARRSALRHLEAPLVAPAIGLGRGDLISDALTGSGVAFLRGAPLHVALNRALGSRKRAILAEAGAAKPLPHLAVSTDRLWAAIGAGSVLRTCAPSTSSAEPTGNGSSEAVGSGAIVAYLRANEVPPAALRRILQHAAAERLPILFVALPSKAPQRPGAPKGTLSALAHRAGLPGMPADTADAVAIYRIAQESIARARAGGGPALVECVSFILPKARASRQTADPLHAIERYVLERRIVTPEWIARETRAFARQLPKPVH